jgi:septin family protein
MSLTEEALRSRFWSGFDCLRSLMDSYELATHWQGLSSASQTPFDEVCRALRLYALVESNVQALTDSLKSSKQKAEQLRAEGRDEEAIRHDEALERAHDELRQLSLFQKQIAERFQAQAEHLQRIASDA